MINFDASVMRGSPQLQALWQQRMTTLRNAQNQTSPIKPGDAPQPMVVTGGLFQFQTNM